MLLIDILQRKNAGKMPFWFMRQAGRYLPEYKKVRANFSDFLHFCYTPEAACEVTLQPITRFDMSAAIIFSDILVIPDALGMQVGFKESVGPQLTPLHNAQDIATLDIGRMNEHLAPVYQAITLTRAALALDKALIGFCGSPWTLACYMLQGSSSRDFAGARSFALKEPEAFTALIEVLVEAVAQHAIAQIKAGADAIQLFDSWSGVLSEIEFQHYVIQPTQKIVSHIKKIHPSIPIIGFPRLCGAKLSDYALGTGVNAVSFDGSVSLRYAKDNVLPQVVLQGNLDSQLLAEDRKTALSQAKEILDNFAGSSFIFNLAHGILPHTPIDNVKAVSDLIKTRYE